MRALAIDPRRGIDTQSWWNRGRLSGLQRQSIYFVHVHGTNVVSAALRKGLIFRHEVNNGRGFVQETDLWVMLSQSYEYTAPKESNAAKPKA